MNVEEPNSNASVSFFDTVKPIMEFRAIAPDQHDFTLFKIPHIDDLDCIFFIKIPSSSAPFAISEELVERILLDPTIGASLDL